MRKMMRKDEPADPATVVTVTKPVLDLQEGRKL